MEMWNALKPEKINNASSETSQRWIEQQRRPGEKKMRNYMEMCGNINNDRNNPLPLFLYLLVSLFLFFFFFFFLKNEKKIGVESRPNEINRFSLKKAKGSSYWF